MRLLAMCLLVGCGGGSDSSPDAGIDAPTAAIVRVDPCPATVDQEVTAEATRFVPMAPTVTAGKVVRYKLSTSHELVPFPDSDPMLAVPPNSERCFKFMKPGMYRYFCKFDGFAGSITVN